MTRPTDDQITEIERAINEGEYDRAVAMLRACKGGSATAKTYEDGLEAAAKVADSYGCCHVTQEIAAEIRALMEKDDEA